jgi:chromosomal replication initiation ATPase DnaA
MIRAALGNHENIFRKFVRNWIRLLSMGMFEEAIKQIDAPNSFGIKWSEESIQKVLQDYVGGDATFSITDPNEMEGDGRPNLIMFDGLQGFAFDYDLPIDRKWSDLTVQFEFIKKSKGYYAVILHDIHVL